MKELKRAEFKKKTGIDLPAGKYRFAIDGNKISYYTVKDDTSGCLLVGENTQKGRVLNSRKYEVKLTAIIKDAIERGEEVWIEIE